MKILIADIIYSKKLSYRQVSLLTGILKSTINDLCNGKMPRLIPFFIDILLFEMYFVRDTISHVYTFNNSKNYGLIKVYIWFPT